MSANLSFLSFLSLVFSLVCFNITSLFRFSGQGPQVVFQPVPANVSNHSSTYMEPQVGFRTACHQHDCPGYLVHA